MAAPEPGLSLALQYPIFRGFPQAALREFASLDPELFALPFENSL